MVSQGLTISYHDVGTLMTQILPIFFYISFPNFQINSFSNYQIFKFPN